MTLATYLLIFALVFFGVWLAAILFVVGARLMTDLPGLDCDVPNPKRNYGSDDA